jgi:hypothetical protein
MSTSGDETATDLQRLRAGAVLGTIANAVRAVAEPAESYDQGWNGDIYVLEPSTDRFGAVAFSAEAAVGVLYDREFAEEPTDIAPIFEGMPAELHRLKRRALQYMVTGPVCDTRPRATTGFWTEDGAFASVASGEQVERRGGQLLRRQWMAPERAIEAWRERYGLSDAQVEVMVELFEWWLDDAWNLDRVEAALAELAGPEDDGLPRAVEVVSALKIES